MTDEIYQINQSLNSRIGELCEKCLPGGRVIGDEYRCRDITGGKGKGKHGGSLAVQINGAKAGIWSDFADGVGGDALGLIQKSQNLSFPETLRWAKEFCGMAVDDPPPAPRTRKKSAAKTRTARRTANKKPDNLQDRRLMALKIWKQTRRIEGTAGEKYLINRGIHARPPAVRFNPRLYHKPTNYTGPAIVAGVQDVRGAFMSIWRIWVMPDGRGRPDIEPSKMGLGMVRGCAVHMGPPVEKELFITEGIETGLSVLTCCPDRSVWAALSTSGMMNIMLPRTVQKVWIVMDHDPAGQKAADHLRARLVQHMVAVADILPPKPGMDFNDIVKRR